MVVLSLFAIGQAPARSYAGSSQKQLSCYGAWADAAGIVQREGLAGIGAVAAKGLRDGHRGILSTRLCQDLAAMPNRQYVYVIVVRSLNGRLKRLVVDAKTLREKPSR